MRKFIFLILCFVCVDLFSKEMFHTQDDIRKYWIDKLERIASPVMLNLSNDSLSAKMPRFQNEGNKCLEAFGRTFCGISRWLDLRDSTQEERKREYYRKLAVSCIRNGFNSKSADYFNFEEGIQPLVDAAYLAQGLIRCPRVWNMIDKETQVAVIEEFKGLRRIKPFGNNWLLFASMLESFIYDKTGKCDEERLLNGIFSFIYGFYVGDGIYGDGNVLVYNYYNSYVIHPMLMDILLNIQNYNHEDLRACLELEKKRYERYVQLLERQILENGTIPVYGRTVTCRLGALNAIAEFVCLTDSVPLLPMAQIRSAMTAVLERQLSDQDFDSDGFLRIGFQSSQLKLAEDYISSGSSYHCTTFFLPLGLSNEHPFWSDTTQAWSACKIYSGQDIVGYDEAYIEHQSISYLAKRLFWRYKNQSEWFKQRMTIIFGIFFMMAIVGCVSTLFIICKFIKRIL